ncbi:MAG: hypothetical protein QMC67_12730 [Candidatus Wallbacteria bacterium]
MIKQFWYELIVGTITLGAVLKFGSAGASAFALMAFLPLILRQSKADEREYYLFYKTGNYTMGLFILALVLINQIQFYTDSSLIEKNWLHFSIVSFLMIHGLTGIVIFNKN